MMTSPTHTCNCSDCDSQTCAYEMRNPSAYVSNFLNAQICCILIMILCASLVLGLGLARTMLIFEKIKRIIFAKIFDFKFSHRRESTRRGKVYRRGGVRRRRASLPWLDLSKLAFIFPWPHPKIGPRSWSVTYHCSNDMPLSSS